MNMIMKLTVLKKINLIAFFAFAALFLVSCDGSTTIYGLEHQQKHKKKYKKYPKYEVRYDDHRSLPPGQHKKVHGDKSAKRYAPGQQKKNNGNYYKKKGHHKHHDD